MSSLYFSSSVYCCLVRGILAVAALPAPKGMGSETEDLQLDDCHIRLQVRQLVALEGWKMESGGLESPSVLEDILGQHKGLRLRSRALEDRGTQNKPQPRSQNTLQGLRSARAVVHKGLG